MLDSVLKSLDSADAELEEFDMLINADEGLFLLRKLK